MILYDLSKRDYSSLCYWIRGLRLWLFRLIADCDFTSEFNSQATKMFSNSADDGKLRGAYQRFTLLSLTSALCEQAGVQGIRR